jgi:hypothetical protein
MSNPKPDCTEFAAALDRWMEHMREVSPEVGCGIGDCKCGDVFSHPPDREHEARVNDEIEREERKRMARSGR